MKIRKKNRLTPIVCLFSFTLKYFTYHILHLEHFLAMVMAKQNGVIFSILMHFISSLHNHILCSYSYSTRIHIYATVCLFSPISLPHFALINFFCVFARVLIISLHLQNKCFYFIRISRSISLIFFGEPNEIADLFLFRAKNFKTYFSYR